MGSDAPELLIPDSLDEYPIAAIVHGSYPSLLTSVTVPEGVVSMGAGVFNDDYRRNLASVSLLSSFASIGEDVFRNADDFTLVVYKGSCAEQYARENGIPYSNYPEE